MKKCHFVTLVFTITLPVFATAQEKDASWRVIETLATNLGKSAISPAATPQPTTMIDGESVPRHAWRRAWLLFNCVETHIRLENDPEEEGWPPHRVKVQSETFSLETRYRLGTMSTLEDWQREPEHWAENRDYYLAIMPYMYPSGYEEPHPSDTLINVIRNARRLDIDEEAAVERFRTYVADHWQSRSERVTNAVRLGSSITFTIYSKTSVPAVYTWSLRGSAAAMRDACKSK